MSLRDGLMKHDEARSEDSCGGNALLNALPGAECEHAKGR
jgi:hypothetical protein